MCGIAGIYNLNQAKVNIEKLKLMTDVIKHRGPDGEGHWINDREYLGLGHRRLSIIDLSDSGDQPMHFANRYTITYNGEIYNYIELKEQLINKGYQFTSNSDTEVLLAIYHKYKENCLQYLDGMFAFAIWDNEEKTLFCARDRFGEKPFYYQYIPEKHFVFASEMKSLFAFGIQQEINNKMLFNYLAYDVVENPFKKEETFYHAVSKLEAAHYIQINHTGKFIKKSYWNINTNNINYSISFEDACLKFKELFQQSIKRRLRSDVAVGSSFSGGIDSSSIVCTIDKRIRETKGVQKTFSARFNNPNLDEGKFISLVTDVTNVIPYSTWPDENTLINELDEIFYHQEEPFGTASILVQWEVMKLAKQKNITVLLDGQGADEILGGYLKYFRVYLQSLYVNNKKKYKKEVEAFEKLHKRPFEINIKFYLEAIAPKINSTLGTISRKYLTPSYFNNFNKTFLSEFKNDFPPFNICNDLNNALYYDTFTYGLEKLLRFSDRNAMAFSREARLPFLNHELVEFLFTLPSNYKIYNGWTKRILRYSMEDILPEKIAWRVEKLAFQPPQADWIKNKKTKELIEEAKSFLIKEKIIIEKSTLSEWQCVMAYKLFEKLFVFNN